jgi:hypothetical protein
MDMNQISRWLIYLGIGLVAAGVIFWLLNKVFSGRNLPGTLQVNIGGMTCVFPILISIVLSIVLTLVLNLIARFLNK